MKKYLPRISVCVFALVILASCQLQKKTGDTASVKPWTDGQSRSIQTDEQALQQVELGTIVAGGDHTLYLQPDGTVKAVGDNEYGQCNVTEWAGIVAVAAGGDFTLGLKKVDRIH